MLLSPARALPMKFEITDEMIQTIQEYLAHVVRFLQTAWSVGKWILIIGLFLTVCLWAVRLPRVQKLLRRRRVR